MSKHGLLPIPIDDISAIRMSRFRFACFHSNFDISSVQAFLMSSLILCRVQVSSGLRLRNQISNFVVESPTNAVRPMSDVLMLFLYKNRSKFLLSGKRRALLNSTKSSKRNTWRSDFLPPRPCHTRNSFWRNRRPCSFTFTCRR